MRKYIYLLIMLVSLLCASFIYAADAVTVVDWTPYAYENISVTSAAVSRPTAEYRDAAGALFLTVEDQNINYRIDSGDPTAVLGHQIVAVYQNLWLNDPAAIRNLRMIATAGTALVKITYYRRQY